MAKMIEPYIWVDAQKKDTGEQLKLACYETEIAAPEDAKLTHIYYGVYANITLMLILFGVHVLMKLKAKEQQACKCPKPKKASKKTAKAGGLLE